MPTAVPMVGESVTNIGSDDGRSIEMLRSENDALREKISKFEKKSHESENRVKELATHIESLKSKIKLLMERGNSGHLQDIVDAAEIESIRKTLKQHDDHGIAD